MLKILYTYRSVATQTNFEENETTRLRSSPGETEIKGRRIIDFQYFFRALKDMNNHSKETAYSKDCNLSDMIITEEKKKGISTSYNLKCLVCDFEKKIFSENPNSNRNPNTDFVSGMISIKGSFQDACILLAKMHLPLVNKDDFIQECKNVVFPVGKTTHRMFKETHQSASKNLQKHVQRESQLTAVKQSSDAHENIQSEHQLTTMQQCSSVSDNSNIKRERQLTTTQQCLSVSDNSNIGGKFQLTTLKQNSSAHENVHKNFYLTIMKHNSSVHKNIQKKVQLTTTKQNSSVHKNIQKKVQLTTVKETIMQQNSPVHKNIQKKVQLTTMKQSSSVHENIQREHKVTTIQQCSSKSNNNNLFEQMHLGGLLVQDQFEIEGNVTEDKNEFEPMMPDQTTETSDSKLIAVQKQITLNTITIKQEINSDDENVTKDENVFETMLPDQTTKTSDSKLIASQEQVMLNAVTIKQEINSDDENFNKSITKKTTNKESVTLDDEQIVIGAMLTEARACESPMIVNQEQVHLQKNLMVKKNKDNNMLIKSETYDMEITDKENVTNFDNKLESEPPLKKARTVAHKKSNNSRDTQGIPTATQNKKISIFQSRSKSNGLKTATSSTTNLKRRTITSNVGTPSSTKTNAGNATATSSIATMSGRKVIVLIPLQDGNKLNENGATLIIPQMPHDIKSKTYQGVSGTACMPGISSGMQQPASIQNVIQNASGATCVPLESIPVQQPAVSSNARPKVSNRSKTCGALSTSIFLQPLCVQKIKEEKKETD